MLAKAGPRSVLGLGIVAALVAALATLALGAMTLTMVHHEIERQLDHRIESETMSLLSVYGNRGFDTVLDVVRSREAQGSPGSTGYLAAVSEANRGIGYIVTDSAGRRRAGRLAAAMPPPGWSEFVHFRRADGSMGVAQAMNVELPGAGRLVVAADRGALHQTDMEILRMLAIQVALVILVVVATIAGFGRLVHLRLAAIRDSARAIMGGDLGRRMPVHRGHSEFDQLAAELNRMLDRIAVLVDNLRQVSSDIAHDLRTPLTRLRHSIEAAGETTDPTLYRERLDAALQEADAALDLFAGLLAVSELEGQSVRARFRPVALAEAVEKIAEAYEPALETAGVALSLDLAPATVFGDQALLQRAVANLLDNLIAHVPPGARATLALRATASEARLTITDDGPGAPAADLARIFERLVRLDPARSGPGHGLGLSMVAAIVRAHGGEVQARSDGAGLTVEITLPRGRDDVDR